MESARIAKTHRKMAKQEGGKTSTGEDTPQQRGRLRTIDRNMPSTVSLPYAAAKEAPASSFEWGNRACTRRSTLKAARSDCLRHSARTSAVSMTGLAGAPDSSSSGRADPRNEASSFARGS